MMDMNHLRGGSNGKGEPPRRVASLGRATLVRAKRGTMVPSGEEIRYKDLPSSEVIP